MAVASKLRAAFRRQKTDDGLAPVDLSAMEENKKSPITDGATENDGTGSEEQPQMETLNEGLQRGVQDIEAITQTWPKWALAAIFIKYICPGCRLIAVNTHLTYLSHSIWFLYFVNAFQSSICYNFIPYLTSDWSSHSLLNVIYIVADSITAACYIPLAKIMDTWGRAEGFLCMTVCATVGLIMMAACHNLPTFCAAYVRVLCLNENFYGF